MKRSLFALCLAALISMPAFAGAPDKKHPDNSIQHVLLISVDGLHSLDMVNFIASHPKSAMAELSSHAVVYTDANTPQLSDSFPGLLALVTGGSPVSHGLFYDVSYDRTIFDPTNTTCSGGAGNMMVFDESIDQYNSQNVSLNVIDPTKLPNHLDAHGNCVRLWPHSGPSDEHDLRSGESRRRTHGVGRQASGLRSGEWSFRQRRRRSLYAGNHQRERPRQHAQRGLHGDE
jgi:predicted AlkP superfamily pyrophosphatase or phosphodiesterase